VEEMGIESEAEESERRRTCDEETNVHEMRDVFGYGPVYW
jgi:hypothetical protein